MLTLDPRSLIALGGLLALALAAVLGCTRRYYPPSMQDLGCWAWAAAVLLGGAVFLVVPAPGQPQLWRWGGNACMVLGFTLFYAGFCRFLRQPLPWWRLLVFYSLALLLLAWYEWMEPSYRMRVALNIFAISIIHLASLRLLWRHGGRRFPSRLLQTTLVLHVCIQLVRLQALLWEPIAGSLLDASGMQTLYISGYVLTTLLLSIGALLLATDRVRTEFEHMATHDALTGALNRRAILDLCDQEHARSVRYGTPFTLMMLDLDHFKSVNDTYGHQHGDQVLVHFASCVRAALRSPDRLGRYGGEEFLALLPNTTPEAALPVAQRIHAALAAGHPLDCQVSIGMASWHGPQDPLQTVLGRADTALYQAKAQGRNQTCTG